MIAVKPVRSVVFPAYAGMSPARHKFGGDVPGFPRLRGDEPVVRAEGDPQGVFAPPTRG